MAQNEFELSLSGRKIKVQRHSISGQVIYRVTYPDGKPPLVLTRALHANANFFWTSIPEGRQAEAEEVGALIAEHLKSVG